MPRKPKTPAELTVETDNDTYTLKVPTGALGWKHFRMLMEVENERSKTITEYGADGKEVIIPPPNLAKVMSDQMDKWIEEILPHILVSHEFDDVPWTDLLAIFQSVSSNTNVNTSSFRDDVEQ